jgi:hypothetical protein
MVEDIAHGPKTAEIHGLTGIFLKIFAHVHDEIIHGARFHDTDVAPADLERMLPGERFAPVGDKQFQELHILLRQNDPAGSAIGRRIGEEAEKPWETERIRWSGNDFHGEAQRVKANMLYVEKRASPSVVLNTQEVGRLQESRFYKAQAMRLPTYDEPRIISCSDESPGCLYLPTGCKTAFVGA